MNEIKLFHLVDSNIFVKMIHWTKRIDNKYILF